MKLVNKDEMEKIDSETSINYGFPSILLMENAGIAISLKILENYSIIKEKNSSISVLVGAGNNGGDGLVIARYFFIHDIPVKVYIVSQKAKFKDDPLTNLNIADKLGIPISFIKDDNDWNSVKRDVLSSDFIIDSIFGTGLKGEVRGFYTKVFRDINNRLGCVISVDVPSGLLTIEDSQNENIVRADTTITVGLPKVGMVDFPGKDYVGELNIVDIGFPNSLLNHHRIKGHIITHNMVNSLLPIRNSNSHKGTYGHLLVIGGSRQYTGAVILACMAALRSGCGLVTLASIPSVCNVLRGYFPEAIIKELPELDGSISYEAVDILRNSLSDYNSIVFGPGIGLSSSCEEVLSMLIKDYEGTLLIDADGLNLLSRNIYILKEKKASIILTPHIKEMARLINADKSELISHKLNISRNFAKEYGITLVLKSAVSLVFHYDGRFFFNTTGNESMASGGTGDVLSGIVGSFMAQGLAILDSAVISIFIHGLAGDHAKTLYTSPVVIASDLISNLNKAFRGVMYFDER